jgi:phosphate transport system substrate-binding protein
MARRRLALVGAVLVGVVAALLAAPSAQAAPARINGTGSTYVALAMQQWVAEGQASGLPVNYTPSGSPQGLSQFADSAVDFAGTEAEYSALGFGEGVQRGFQYVPDVAGAVAIMYNVKDTAGRKVDYLHLSRLTVAKIFTGAISNWNDPAIKADNGGVLDLPSQAINVVYRGGQSGTTALFYDFVEHTLGDAAYTAWANKNQLPTDVRIVQLDTAPGFAPKTQALNGSDQIAQYTASSSGLWSIAYDEFGYAVTYKATASWIQNESGAYVLPFAENISAALESAKLRADLSQDLAGVYASTNPDAYPISAYSYIVTQCAPTGERATCHGNYTNSGVSETLAKWMRYIACDGQVNMAKIGYSPLPPNLSQEMANSIGRMTGQAPEQLSKSNCKNPRFGGSLGGGAVAPEDPLADVPGITPGGGGSTGGATGGTGGSSGGSTGGSGGSTGGSGGSTGGSGGSTGGSGGSTGGSGGTGAVTESGVAAVGGGSSDIRASAPVRYDRSVPAPQGPTPLVLLIVVLFAPLGLALAWPRLREGARDRRRADLRPEDTSRLPSPSGPETFG